MLSGLRRDFNRRWTPEAYQQFLRLLDDRCGTHVKFRCSETPLFLPDSLVDEMTTAGADLLRQLTGNAEYLAAARAQIPAEFFTPNEDALPLFAQVDFGLIREESGKISPRLVEIQAFPSLYGMQPVLAETYRDAYSLSPHLRSNLGSDTPADYTERLRRAIVGDHDPKTVILLETDPQNQKTLPDFLVTEKLLGIRTVDIRDLRKDGRKLSANGIPVTRIYNRAIADELARLNVASEFRFTDDVDVEWAGHPNWFFLISKFSLPYLHHETVPESWFLSDVTEIPEDLQNYVLKPLYSFAGLGVKVGPERADIDAIPPEERSGFLLQKRMRFEPVIETPHGGTQAEIRVMYIWQNELTPVNMIIRMGRGKMMGVDHNRDLEWVGASAAFHGADLE